LRSLSGADAGQLWNRWRHRRDEEAREQLTAYNEADCVNLQPLADLFYCQMVQRHRSDSDAIDDASFVSAQANAGQKIDRGNGSGELPRFSHSDNKTSGWQL
jgi:hypothetical protein